MFLLDGSVLITGEVDRTTDFERGMSPQHQAFRNNRWEADPLVIDDQALLVNVRDLGLVVLTGCGHTLYLWPDRLRALILSANGAKTTTWPRGSKQFIRSVLWLQQLSAPHDELATASIVPRFPAFCKAFSITGTAQI